MNVAAAASQPYAMRPPFLRGATISARPSPSRSPSEGGAGLIVGSDPNGAVNCCAQVRPSITRSTPGPSWLSAAVKLLKTID
ncbi:MAG: hypothetical protein AAB092_08400, partial [Chloroflexota bacterium]